MAGYTGTELISAVTVNIGNRSSGKIGGIAISTALLTEINNTLMELAVQLSADELQKIDTIDIVEDTFQYALPTTYGKIKNIDKILCLADDETSKYALTRLPEQKFLARN